MVIYQGGSKHWSGVDGELWYLIPALKIHSIKGVQVVGVTYYCVRARYPSCNESWASLCFWLGAEGDYNEDDIK